MHPHIDQPQRATTFYGGQKRSEVHLDPPEDILQTIFLHPANDPVVPKMTDLTRQQVTDMLAASEAKVDARLANFDTSVKTGFADLRTEFAGVRADMAKQNGDFRADMAKLQAEVHKNTADLIKWAIGLAVAVVGMTVGLLTFINKSVERPAPQPIQASAPVPTIVAVPAGSTVLSAPQAPAATAAPPAK